MKVSVLLLKLRGNNSFKFIELFNGHMEVGKETVRVIPQSLYQ